MTMVEKIADAISRSFHEEGYIEGVSHPSEWEEFKKAARSVLEAMREPTDAMVAVTGDLSRDPIQTYTDMIDAALKE